MASALPPLEAGQQLFILLSQARSGTSWLTAMLNSHTDVVVEEEILMRLRKKNKKPVAVPACACASSTGLTR